MGMFGPYGKYIVLWDMAHVSIKDPTMWAPPSKDFDPKCADFEYWYVHG